MLHLHVHNHVPFVYTPPSPACPPPFRLVTSPPAGVTNDLSAFSAATLLWARLAPAAPPSPRAYHGFAAAAGRLYVFGGQDSSGARTCPYKDSDKDSDNDLDKDSDNDSDKGPAVLEGLGNGSVAGSNGASDTRTVTRIAARIIARIIARPALEGLGYRLGYRLGSDADEDSDIV